MELKDASITVKELLAIVLLACAIWGPMWRCSSMMVHCDNTVAIMVINSGCSRGLSGGTVKCYLAALCYTHISLSLGNLQIFNMSQLEYVIKAVRNPQSDLLVDASQSSQIYSLFSNVFGNY